METDTRDINISFDMISNIDIILELENHSILFK